MTKVDAGLPSRSSPSGWRAIVPFRLQGEENNDFNVRQRIGWIVALAIGGAIALGAIANLLEFLSAIARR